MNTITFDAWEAEQLQSPDFLAAVAALEIDNYGMVLKQVK